MRVKLDENLGKWVADLFRHAGHDVSTVREQNLSGASDAQLIEICRTEDRCLVTLDLEFGNPIVFKPSNYAGIIVLRLQRRPTPDDLRDAVQTLLHAPNQERIKGNLWIVQRGRIRQYQQEDEE